MPRISKIAILTSLLLLIWSALFASTFRYPFFWDDFHLIRPYSGPEILSAFHGVIDPDKIETPGLRSCSILLYNLQGSLFGENVVAHRIFMIVLMGAFLMATGMVLLETGLGFLQVAIVFVLFVFSRVFASLVLWISLSHIILAYIWIVLTAYFFLRWVKRGRWFFFFLMLATFTLATFTREESYTLPVVLPLLWLISSFDASRWRQVAIAALSISVIVCFHYWLWHFLVPNALSPEFTGSAAKRFLVAMAASWLPGGYQWIGFTDKFIGIVWVGFLIGVGLLFIRLASPRVRWQFLGACCLGVLLSLPAIGVARSYGIALPTLAFMTAISIAISEVYRQMHSQDRFRKWPRYAFVSSVILGLAVGIGGGIHRSIYVAESMQENCAKRVDWDGRFLFDLFDRPATIPESRRQAGLARLRTFGIQSADDLRSLQKTLRQDPNQYRQRKPTTNGLFLPKYDYLSF
jgi:hypothetical protein